MRTDHQDIMHLNSNHMHGSTKSASSNKQFGSAQHKRADVQAKENLPIKTEYVVPLLWTAILTGALVGYFWKSKC
jgi:hypothetical protein